MTAQKKYITSLLLIFSTFLESNNVSRSLALLTTEKFIVFINKRKKSDVSWQKNWSTKELENFISAQNIPHKPAFLIRKFIKQYTPLEIDIFLHEFLTSLKSDNRSNSTIKNYRSDIQQFSSFVKSAQIKKLFEPDNLRSFVHSQLDNGLKISTIKRKLSSISQFALWAEEEKIVQDASFWISDIKSLYTLPSRKFNKKLKPKTNIELENQKTASKEADFGKPTGLPICELDKLSNILSKNSNLSSNNVRGDVEIGGIEPPRRGLSSPQGKPAIPTSVINISQKRKQTKPKSINKQLEDFLINLKINGHSKSTIRNYKSDINQFFKYTKKNTTPPISEPDKLSNIVSKNNNWDPSAKSGYLPRTKSTKYIYQNNNLPSDNLSLENLVTEKQIIKFVISQKKSGLQISSIKRKVTSISQFALWAENRNALVGVSSWIHQLPNQLFKVKQQVRKMPSANYLGHLDNLNNQNNRPNHHSINQNKLDINRQNKQNKTKYKTTTQKFELKLKPNNLIHAHHNKIHPKKQGWSLPIPDFASSKSVNSNFNQNHKHPFKKNKDNKNQANHKTNNTQENKNVYAGIKSSLQDFANQINTKRNQKFLPYLNLGMMILFVVGLGVLGYQQFITQAPSPLAYPSSPTRPNRELSFQGRLTDTAQNPITSTTDMAFRLYDNTSGGTQLWSSGTCSVTPDQDGIFNVGLGDDCGSEITENVFTENSNVWLEVEIDSETLTPRQSIKTVAYALNSETVQGYPVSATGEATVNTILVMDDGGQVLLGEVSPTLKATSGTFSIEAQALTLQTSSGSDGDIILAPDGLGEVLSTGYFSAPGATFSATYAGGTSLVLKGGPGGTGNIQEWQDSGGGVLSVVGATGEIGVGISSPVSAVATTRTGTGGKGHFTFNRGPATWGIGTGDETIPYIYIGGGYNSDGLTSNIETQYFWRAQWNDISIPANTMQTASKDVGVVVLGVKGSNGQTANLTEWQNSSGTALTVVDASGNIGIGTNNPTQKLQVSGGAIKLDNNQSVMWRNAANNADVPILSLDNSNIFNIGSTSSSTPAQIRLYTAQNERVRIDANGNIGIGTTSPLFLLDVAGTASVNSLNINDAYTFPTSDGSTDYILQTNGSGSVTWEDPSNITGAGLWANTLNVFHPKNELASVVDLVLGGTSTASANIHLQSNGQAYFGGNVGIGTTGPNSLLEIQGNGVAGNLSISNSNTSILSGNELGRLSFRNYDSSINYSTFTGEVASIRAIAANDFIGANGASTDLYFYTNETAPADGDAIDGGDVKMVITSAGNIGIGTTTPLFLLDVAGTASVNSLNINDAYTFPTSDGSTDYILQTNGSGSVTWEDPSNITGAGLWANTLNVFHPKNELASVVDLVLGGTSTASANIHLQANGQAYFAGNVGIGTDNPATPLDVIGTGTLTKILGQSGTDLIVASNDESFFMTIKDTSQKVFLNTSTDDARFILSPITSNKNAEFIFSEANSQQVGAAFYYDGANNSFKINLGSGGGDIVDLSGNTVVTIGRDNKRFGIGTQNADDIDSKFHVLGTSDETQQIIQAYSSQTTNLTEWQDSSGAVLSVVDAGGNVGIGTTTPTTDLHIYNSQDASTSLMVQNPSAGASARATLSIHSNGGGGVYLQAPSTTYSITDWRDSGVLSVDSSLDNGMILYSSDKVRIQNVPGTDVLTAIGGNVGIGTTTPLFLLDVAGTASVNSLNINDAYTFPTSDGSTDYILQTDGAGSVTWEDPSNITGAGLWANTLNVFHPKNELASVVDLVLGGTSTASANIHLQSNGQAYFAGNIGIGTTTPESILHLNSTTGSYSDDRIIIEANSAPRQNFIGLTDDADELTIAADEDNLGASSAIKFRIDADEKMRITSEGNVGVGTTTPGGNLHVSGGDAGAPILQIERDDGGVNDNIWDFRMSSVYSGNNASLLLHPITTDADLNFGTDAASTTPLLTLKSNNGNVGIGTTAPLSKLAIEQDGDTLSHGLTLTRTSTYRGTIFLDSVSHTLNINRGETAGTGLSVEYGGNIGIGTTNPLFLLDVAGTASVNSLNINDAYTFPTSDGSTDYILQTNGSGSVTWEDPSNITGAGLWDNTLNVFHPKNELASVVDLVLGGTSTASANIHLQSNGQAYFGGNVGIGTISPSIKLEVAGGIFANNENTVSFASGANGNAQLAVIKKGGENAILAAANNEPLRFGKSSANSASLIGTAVTSQTITEFARFDSNGNYGIGTTSPLFLLDVAGTASLNSLNINDAYTFPTIDGTNGYVLQTDGGGTVSWASVLTDSPNVGAWSHGDHFLYPDEYWADDLIIGGNSTASATFQVKADGSGYFAGNVGLGTTAPDGQMHILGSSAGAVAAPAWGDEFVIESSSAPGITILGPDAQTGRLLWGSPTDNYSAQVGMTQSTGLMQIGTKTSGGEIALETADGVEAARIDSAGNVGIGTTAPNGLLEVANYSAGVTRGDFIVDSANKTTYVGRLSSTGSDHTKFIVRDRLGTEYFVSDPTSAELYMNPGSTVSIGLGTNSAQSGSRVDIRQLGAKTATSYGSYTQNISTSSTASINKYGAYITSTGTWNGASANNIGLYVGSVTGGTNNYDAIFNGGGNVGIGTTAPGALLDIAQYADSSGINISGYDDMSANTIKAYVNSTGRGYIYASDQLRLDSGANVIYTVDRVYLADGTWNYTNTNNRYQAGANYWSIGSEDTNNTLQIVTGSTLNSNVALAIDTNGNIGIGSTTPGYALDLVGEFNLTDAIRVAGDAGTSGYFLTSSAGGANTWTDPDSITGAGLWANTLNVFHPKNELASVVDLVLGGTSTASANIHLQSNGQAYFAGNVGIGTTGPETQLHLIGDGTRSEVLIDGNTSGNYISLRHANAAEGTGNVNKAWIAAKSTGDLGILGHTTSGGTEVDVLSWLQNGNVGIGTTTPTAKLEISGAGSASLDTHLIVGGSGNGDSGGVRGTAIDIQVPGLASQEDGARISVHTVGGAVTSQSTDLSFSIANNGTLIEALRIDNTGNIGIGTATPSEKLHISEAGESRIKIQDSTANEDLQIGIFPSDGAAFFSRLGTGGNDIEIYANGDTGIGLQGNVGIGTTTPLFLLDVAGTASLNSLNINDAYTFPTSDGSTDYILQTDGSGSVTWEDPSNITGAGLWANTLNVFHPKNELASVVDLVLGGTSTASAKFQVFGDSGRAEIDLGSDSVGLTIQGDASQSVNLTEWQDSSGVVSASINKDGWINTPRTGVGVAPNSAYRSTSYENNTGTSGEVINAYNYTLVQPTGNTSSKYTSLYNRTLLANNFDYTGDAQAIYALVDFRGSSIQNLYGSRTQIISNSAANSPTATNIFGSRITIDKSLFTTITNSYGQYIDNVSGATNNYAIYTNAGDVILNAGNDAGTNIGIGTTTPLFLLDVAGTASLNSLNINDAYTFPTSDGSVDYILQTNGSGSVTWEDPSNITGAGLWANTLNVFHPKNELASVVDLVLGGTSTASAKFQAFGDSGRVEIDLASNSVGLTIQADASQTNNLTEWQDSSGAVLSVVDESGNVGAGTTTPGQNVAQGTSDFSGNVIHVKNTLGRSHVVIEGHYGAFIDLIDYHGTSNSRILQSEYDGGVLVTRSLNDDLTTKVDNILSITSIGNVGIGTTSPSSFKLEVDGNVGPALDNTYSLGSASRRWANIYSSGNIIATGLWDADTDTGIQVEEASDEDIIRFDTAGSERMVIDAGGNVGIGTTGPRTTLDIVKANQDLTPNVSGATQVHLALRTNDDVAIDNGPAIGFGGTYITGSTTPILYASIAGRKTSATSGNADGYLSFHVWQTDGLKEKMRITHDGNIGIGTTTPSGLLDITGSATGQALVQLQEMGDQDILTASNSAGVPRFRIANTGYTYAERFLDISGPEYYLDPDSDTISMVVASNVGIGTTSPGSILELASTSNTQINIKGGSASLHPAIALIDEETGGVQWNIENGREGDGILGFYRSGTKMVINNNGNVGIGTTSPGASLHVATNITTGNLFKIGYTSATTQTGDLVGLDLDLNTNVTGSSNAEVTGINIQTPTLSAFGSTKTYYYGNRISAGALDTGTDFTPIDTDIYWYGNHIQMPNIDTGESVDSTTSYGLYIDGGTVTNGPGTENQYGLIVDSSAGNVGIGTTAPASKLDVVSDIASQYAGSFFNDGNNANRYGLQIQAGADSGAGNLIQFRDGNGTDVGEITFFGTTTTYGTSSDFRMKQNIRTTSMGLSDLMDIEIKDYEFKAEYEDDATYIGYIAQDLYEILPHAVYKPSDTNTMWSVDYGKVTPLIVKSIQEQQSQIALISTEIDSLGFDATGNLNIANTTTTTDLEVTQTASIFDLSIENLTIGGQSIASYITNIVNNIIATTPAPETASDLISPVVTETTTNTAIDIASASGSIVFRNSTDNTIAEISETGNLNLLGSLLAEEIHISGETSLGSLLVTTDATISGTITTNNLTAQNSVLGSLITNQATISGTLTTNNLLANTTSIGSLLTQDATVSGTLKTDTLITDQIEATSSRIALLEAGMAELEHVKATTAEIVTATISGTLYADSIYANSIYDFEETLLTALQQPSLLDIITGTNQSTTSATAMADLYDTINKSEYNATSSADLDLSFSEISMTSDDVTITGTALFIEKYFKVNGAGYISDSLAIGNSIFINNSLVVGDENSNTSLTSGVIAYTTQNPTNQILRIQPEGQGSIELLAGIVTIDSSGKVTVNGDFDVTGNAKIAGTLLTNQLKPTDFGNPLQVQVAGADTETNEIKKSRFEIINEVGTPVATFSAEGNAKFAGDVEIKGNIDIGGELKIDSQDLGSSDTNELTADKTSGKATILSGANEVKINSSLITNNTLIYVTAVGSTNNQVIYVKAQTEENTETPEQEGKFVVGFDNDTTADVSFNWWIVN